MTTAQRVTIPFNRPSTAKSSVPYVTQALLSGRTSGDGPYTKRCGTYLTTRLGAPAALLTTSCTDALEMAALLTRIQPGDEVIVPSFTFSSTAAAFALFGATIVFADVRGDTLNINENDLPNLITQKTKAVVVVHYAGVGCEMDTITALCQDAGIALVEDNAHGLFGRYRGRNLGSFGVLSTLSFHETKNLSCGEGGALIINDPSLVDRAEIIREKGTNRSQFWRGQVDKYTWVDHGSSFLPADYVAAALLAQFEEAEVIQAKRKALWDRYRRDLTGWATAQNVKLPYVPPDCEQPYHMFYLRFPSASTMEAARQYLVSMGILAVTHYVPLHSSPQGKRVGRGACPVAEEVSATLLRLPFYTDMSDEEADTVVAEVTSLTL